MIKTVLTIEGMSCGMCEAHINETIRRNFKVKRVNSSHKKNLTEIISEEPLNKQILKDVIGSTGYTLTSISEETYIKRNILKR